MPWGRICDESTDMTRIQTKTTSPSTRKTKTQAPKRRTSKSKGTDRPREKAEQAKKDIEEDKPQGPSAMTIMKQAMAKKHRRDGDKDTACKRQRDTRKESDDNGMKKSKRTTRNRKADGEETRQHEKDDRKLATKKEQTGNGTSTSETRRRVGEAGGMTSLQKRDEQARCIARGHAVTSEGPRQRKLAGTGNHTGDRDSLKSASDDHHPQHKAHRRPMR
jgi:hypothetical protein